MNKKVSLLGVFSLVVLPTALFAQGQLVKPVSKAFTVAEYMKLSEKMFLEQIEKSAVKSVPMALPSMEQLLLPSVEEQILRSPSMQAITEQNLKNLQLKIDELAKRPKPLSRPEYFARLQAKNHVPPVRFQVMGATGYVYAFENTALQETEPASFSILKRSWNSLKSFLKTSSNSSPVASTSGVEIIPSPIADKVPAALENRTRELSYHQVAEKIKNKQTVTAQEAYNVLHTARYGVQKFLQLVEDSAGSGAFVEMTGKDFAKLMADASFLGVFGSEQDILPLVGVLRAMPKDLAPYADAIVGRSLVSLKGYAGLNEIAALRATDGLLIAPFWRDLRIYNESYLLGVSVPASPNELEVNIKWDKYDVYLKEYSILNVFDPYIHVPAWMSIVLNKRVK